MTLADRWRENSEAWRLRWLAAEDEAMRLRVALADALARAALDAARKTG